MPIQIDTREHKREVERIEKQFDSLGINHFRSKLYCGDYQSLDNGRLVIDRKKDLLEICGNVTQQHERFRRELARAQGAGIQLIILCEHGGEINGIEDVYFWHNPRLDEMEWATKDGRPCRIQKNPNATTGKQLYKSMMTIQERYGVKWVFCDKRHTGKRIAELLGVIE